MLPFIQKPPISRLQKAIALFIAGCADLFQLGLFPIFMEGGASPFEDVLDVFVALALMIVCGFRWQFIVAFAMELIPGYDLLPTWTAVVLLIPSGAPAGQIEEYAQEEQEEIQDVVPNETSTASAGPPPVLPPPRITATSVPPQIAPPLQREP